MDGNFVHFEIVSSTFLLQKNSFSDRDEDYLIFLKLSLYLSSFPEKREDLYKLACSTDILNVSISSGLLTLQKIHIPKIFLLGRARIRSLL